MIGGSLSFFGIGDRVVVLFHWNCMEDGQVYGDLVQGVFASFRLNRYRWD